MKRVCLNIGDIVVTREPAVLETILGSCVAVCLWDARRRIGGLNHYLVPTGHGEAKRSNMYGASSIRNLVEQTFRLGADRHSLQARIFGGGTILKPLEDIFTIGAENVRIAREILGEYGIPVVHDFVGAECGIRIAFKTSDGAVSVICFDQESGRRYQDFYRSADGSSNQLRSVHTAVFFKDQRLLTLLNESVLPKLLQRRRTTGELRIWSVGCGTGEAAYSIAISLHGALPTTGEGRTSYNSFGDWTIKILATDTSLKSLVTAETAIYGAEQLPEQLPPERAGCYFLKGNGAWSGYIKVKSYIQDTIRFRRFNLKNGEYPFKRHFDLIFCHDGLLSFDDSTRQQAFKRLHKHLTNDGYLLVSQEHLLPDNSLFEQLDHGLFRKC